jgi:hypothetical protein
MEGFFLCKNIHYKIILSNGFSTAPTCQFAGHWLLDRRGALKEGK